MLSKTRNIPIFLMKNNVQFFFPGHKFHTISKKNECPTCKKEICQNTTQISDDGLEWLGFPVVFVVLIFPITLPLFSIGVIYSVFKKILQK